MSERIVHPFIGLVTRKTEEITIAYEREQHITAWIIMKETLELLKPGDLNKAKDLHSELSEALKAVYSVIEPHIVTQQQAQYALAGQINNTPEGRTWKPRFMKALWEANYLSEEGYTGLYDISGGKRSDNQ